jgi:hypothetical protein
MTIGNMVIGEMYIEPQGPSDCINHTTKEICELDYKVRGWTSKNNNSVNAVIKDKNGVAKFHLIGKYTESINLVNLETQESEELWVAVEKPKNHELMYGMSGFSL